MPHDDLDKPRDTTLLALLWQIDGSTTVAIRRVQVLLRRRRVRLIGLLRDHTEDLITPTPPGT